MTAERFYPHRASFHPFLRWNGGVLLERARGGGTALLACGMAATFAFLLCLTSASKSLEGERRRVCSALISTIFIHESALLLSCSPFAGFTFLYPRRGARTSRIFSGSGRRRRLVRCRPVRQRCLPQRLTRVFAWYLCGRPSLLVICYASRRSVRRGHHLGAIAEDACCTCSARWAWWATLRGIAALVSSGV